MIVENLKNLACKHFKVTRQQIDGSGRKMEVVYARIAISKILHENGFKIIEIATILNMNHSTITHYISTFSDRIKYDVIFANTFNDFKKECE